MKSVRCQQKMTAFRISKDSWRRRDSYTASSDRRSTRIRSGRNPPSKIISGSCYTSDFTPDEGRWGGVLACDDLRIIHVEVAQVGGRLGRSWKCILAVFCCCDWGSWARVKSLRYNGWMIFFFVLQYGVLGGHACDCRWMRIRASLRRQVTPRWEKKSS